MFPATSGRSPGRSAATLRAIARAFALQGFEPIFLADEAQFLAVAVVRERLDDVAAGAHELPVELRHDVGVVQHHLGHVRAGLQVAPPFELEQVALRAEDRAVAGEPLVECARA